MMRVMGARLLVKRIPAPEQVESGLYLLGREKPLIAEVLVVGNGERGKHGVRKPITDIQAGDYVQLKRNPVDMPDVLELREVAEDTYIVDYDRCLAGMRREGDHFRTWPLGEYIMIRRASAVAQ